MPEPTHDGALSPKEWRIIEALLRLSTDGPKLVTYEDIVVRAWKLYPNDFGLRGYSEQYPDASDIHKPLYNTLKSRGWVKSGPPGQKKFALTPSGWERARQHFGDIAKAKTPVSGRARRTTEEEIRHLERTEAARLYVEGKQDDILDTDFYKFYRTSVRAGAQEFEGRLSEVGSALSEATERHLDGAFALSKVDDFLRAKFSAVIASKSERKKREG